MMKLAYKTITVLVCLVAVGCNQLDEQRYYALEKAGRSIDVDLEQKAMTAFRRTEDRWFNPRTRHKALLWLDKARQVRQSSSAMARYLDSLRAMVHSGVITPSQVFSAAQEHTRLYERILRHKEEMISLLGTGQFADNPRWMAELARHQRGFERRFKVLPVDTALTGPALMAWWSDQLTADGQQATAGAMLQCMKGRLRMFEVELLDYVGYNTSVMWCGYDVTNPMACLSSSMIKAGQPVLVYTGYGTENFTNGIRIRADTIPLLIDHSGWAERKVPIQGMPGKYTLPVHFEYEENGQIRTQTQLLEYVIAP